MKRSERFARLLVITFSLGVVLVPLMVYFWPQNVVNVHARMAESGGWSPAALQAQVGVPLHLRLASDDVMHGFAVGQMDIQPVDVVPGKPAELTLTFDKPGTYTFYCTRWCGINHWRMRGTIEVTGPAPDSPEPVSVPLYVTLGLDIDAPHPAAMTPAAKPSALRGKLMALMLPEKYRAIQYYRSHSLAQAFIDLRADPALKSVNDAEIWDLVAYIWRANQAPAELAQGKQVYAQNCAACHGEDLAGNGVFAESLAASGQKSFDNMGSIQNMQNTKPTNFTDPVSMFGASPALLEGKIIRGGMGTGMPMWGSIFTDQQIKSIIGYLYMGLFDDANP
jgi:mono/diheme cytochrome c family protein/plastocyanin